MPYLVAESQAGSSGFPILLVLLPFLLLALMFFTQRRRSQATMRAQAALRVGDEVRTTSGLFGTLRELDDVSGHLEIAPGTVIRVDRRAVGVREAEMSRGQVAGTAAGRGEEPADNPVQDPVVTAESAVDDEGQRGRP